MNSKIFRAIFCFVLILATSANAFATGAIAASSKGGFWIETYRGQLERGSFYDEIAVGGAPKLSDQGPHYISGLIAATSSNNGYWLVYSKTGFVESKGDANPNLCQDLGKCTAYHDYLGAPIVSVAAVPSGGGFWALDSDGNVWCVGSAVDYGSWEFKGGAVEILPTPSGKGYYLFGNDGGVVTKGDAIFLGSSGGNGRYIVGAALSYDENGKVNGYWSVTQSGTVQQYGNAAFYGSTGGVITGMTSLPSHDGYAISKKDGSYAVCKMATGSCSNVVSPGNEVLDRRVETSPFQ